MLSVARAHAAGRASARLRVFVEMSAALTGLPACELSPAFDPLDLKRVYLDTADGMAGASTVDALLVRFRGLSGAAPAEVADALLEAGSSSPSATARLAEAIVKLWLLGAWCPHRVAEPASAREPEGSAVTSTRRIVAASAPREAEVSLEVRFASGRVPRARAR